MCAGSCESGGCQKDKQIKMLKDALKHQQEETGKILVKFCEDIEVTGGIYVDQDGVVGCVADEDWLDLALTYRDACHVLHRAVKSVDADKED